MSITTRGLLKGATVLVAALAWNEAAKSAVDYIVPLNRDHQDKSKRMIANVVYATIVTLIILIIIFMFNKANAVSNIGETGVYFEGISPSAKKHTVGDLTVKKEIKSINDMFSIIL